MAATAPAPEEPAVTRPWSRALRFGGWFGLAKVLDQGSLGVITLVLAAVSSVEEYATVAVLLVGYAAATTLADMGVAHELLRVQPGQRADRSALALVWRVGLGAAVAGLTLLGVSDGGVAQAVGATGVVWAIAAGTYLRQSAAVLQGEYRRLAIAQGSASALLVGAVFAVVILDRHSTLVVAGLLVARLGFEWLLLPRARSWFIPGGAPLRPLPVFTTHLVAFGGRNVDYLVAGPLLGAVAFAQYVLAYRLANACYAPLGAVTTRLGITELGDRSVADPAAHHRRLVAALIIAGSVAAAVTMVASTLVPRVAGPQWAAAGSLMSILAVAIPWRFLEGLIAPLAYTSGRHGDAVRLEAARLLVASVAVIAGATAGVWGLAVAMTVATTLTSWGGHRWMAWRTGRRSPRFLDVAVVVTLAVIGVVAASATVSP